MSKVKQSVPLFFNDDQILRHNCMSTDNMFRDNYDIIISKIHSIPCESTNWHSKFSYWISNCYFSLKAFKDIVDTISSHILQCKEEIVQYTSSNIDCTISIDFNNQNNNTNIGVEGINYITNAMHTVSKTISTISPDSIEFVMQFVNNGILIDKVKELTNSCPNIRVDNLMYPQMVNGQLSFTTNNNHFGIFVNNTDINNTDCIFNQVNDDPEASQSSAWSDEDTTFIYPLASIGVVAGFILGISLLSKYAYSKYFPSNESIHEMYNPLQQDVELSGIHYENA